MQEGPAPQIVRSSGLSVICNQKEGVGIVLAEQTASIAPNYADFGDILESGRIMINRAAAFDPGMSSEGRRSETSGARGPVVRRGDTRTAVRSGLACLRRDGGRQCLCAALMASPRSAPAPRPPAVPPARC